MTARRVTGWGITASGAVAVAVAFGCSSGGSGGSSGGTSADPVAQCNEFFTLTQDCYRQAGEEFRGNSAACGDPTALDERTRGQIECALASRNAYCTALVAGLTRDAGGIDPRDPELLKLNQCNAEKTTTGDCRLAVQKLGECGGTAYFRPDCAGRDAALAKCVLDNPTGACALYAPREGGATFPPEAQTFQQCQIEAAKIPDPDEEPEPDGGF
jgi:hypothetical protein